LFDLPSGAGVRPEKRRLGGGGGQLHRRHAEIAGIVDVLSRLAHADDDRGSRVDGRASHYRPLDEC